MNKDVQIDLQSLLFTKKNFLNMSLFFQLNLNQFYWHLLACSKFLKIFLKLILIKLFFIFKKIYIFFFNWPKVTFSIFWWSKNLELFFCSFSFERKKIIIYSSTRCCVNTFVELKKSFFALNYDTYNGHFFFSF